MTFTRDRVSKWQELRALCMVCRHSAPIDVDRFPVWEDLLLLERKLHCMKCGNKNSNVFQIGPKESLR